MTNETEYKDALMAVLRATTDSDVPDDLAEDPGMISTILVERFHLLRSAESRAEQLIHIAKDMVERGDRWRRLAGRAFDTLASGPEEAAEVYKKRYAATMDMPRMEEMAEAVKYRTRDVATSDSRDPTSAELEQLATFRAALVAILKAVVKTDKDPPGCLVDTPSEVVGLVKARLKVLEGADVSVSGLMQVGFALAKRGDEWRNLATLAYTDLAANLEEIGASHRFNRRYTELMSRMGIEQTSERVQLAFKNAMEGANVTV